MSLTGSSYAKAYQRQPTADVWAHASFKGYRESELLEATQIRITLNNEILWDQLILK